MINKWFFLTLVFSSFVTIPWMLYEELHEKFSTKEVLRLSIVIMIAQAVQLIIIMRWIF